MWLQTADWWILASHHLSLWRFLTSVSSADTFDWAAMIFIINIVCMNEHGTGEVITVHLLRLRLLVSLQTFRRKQGIMGNAWRGTVTDSGSSQSCWGICVGWRTEQQKLYLQKREINTSVCCPLKAHLIHLFWVAAGSTHIRLLLLCWEYRRGNRAWRALCTNEDRDSLQLGWQKQNEDYCPSVLSGLVHHFLPAWCYLCAELQHRMMTFVFPPLSVWQEAALTHVDVYTLHAAKPKYHSI